ncbi:MAG: hypothetical protein IPN17_02545 [Deltaproteobacteria bacterium]|nr:hypothetical protein [Deltaproteobacteria bacterium]
MKNALGLVGCLLFVGLAVPACGDNSVVGGPDVPATGSDVPDELVDAGFDAGFDAGLDAPSDLGAPDAPADAAEVGDVGADVPVGLCRDNIDCGGNEFGFRVCDTATGACVACTATNRGSCAAGQYCTPASRCEAGCAVDADCAADGGTFRCDPVGHVCVGCTRDDQCAPGTVCGAMATCVPGCNDRQACPSGEACCADACRRVQLDVAHCGGCGRACAAPNGVAGCAAGVCVVAACSTGFGDCDGNAANGCEVAVTDSVAHCGSCGSACAAGANATATCAAGRCAVRCAAGFADCDDNPANGCEVDTRVTSAHCGACGQACAAGANATATCAAGRCAATCAPGFGDCDDNPANGCEASLTSDPARCGTCSTTCSGGTNARPVCGAGVCRLECAAGFADCDGDARNGCEAALDGTASCGACGVICSGGTPLCATSGGASACASGCAAGQVRCSGACADTRTDVTDCGSCGNACPAVANAARTCTAGACGFACNAGFADCDANPANGCEVFTGTDARHCGGCGTACAAGANATATCALGRCGLDCATGFADCDANPANGCEVDTRASAAHCGVCGRSCPGGANATATCAAGACGVACAAGFADCDANPANGCEASTLTSAEHCGGCGMACASGVCAAGRCGSLTTCRTIHETLPAAPSGVFTIDPDGPGGAAAFDVYCDMTTDGGGWTLVAYASRGSVAALNSDTGVRNLYSLATGGGTYDGLNRRGVASLAAVPIARRSREMLLSRSNADFFTGPVAAYDVANKFTIPSPSTVNFLNANPAVALPERGACVPVILTTLRGPSATGAMRYVFQNTLSVSWTDTYPTSYGVMDTSNCYNGSLGPNYVSDYTGVGNARSYPWPRAPDGAAHTYWHLGWWDATATSRTGSIAIWLR